MQGFYEKPDDSKKASWVKWLRDWRGALSSEEDGGGLSKAAKRMRKVNPKYIPREWMLVEAYEKAAHGDYTMVHELYQLFLHPYDEQPDFEAKYYRLAPKEALHKGGIARMT
mmetsp:Transcript_117135/g.229744  ORF Transcript_117135/g.229744 Transcript_117135/m.229744 type:complete len:112 (+) Transcript_117135:2-337(+)